MDAGHYAYKIQQFNKLIEVSQLSAKLGAMDLLQMIVDSAASITDSNAASILLLDEARGAMKFVAGPWSYLNILDELNVPVDRSVAGMVLRDGTQIQIQHAGSDARIYQLPEDAIDFKTHSLAAVPINYCGTKVGVLEVVNKLHGQNYSPDDLFHLEYLAAHAAVALEHVRLEIDQERLLEQMNELEQRKRDFIAITSHELRTPLGLILGHATFLRSMLKDSEKRAQVDAIVESAVRLKNIIEALSRVDSLESGTALVRSRVVNLTEIINDVVTTFSGMAQEKDIHLAADAEPDLLIEADGDKLGIILSNLIRNALTFTNKGGNVEIKAFKSPGYLNIQVIDNGIGIPESDLERVFERFYQVEAHMTRKHGGMGLGLAVAREMVALQDGRIWAESEHGKGSTFHVELPLISTR